ncbi:MAG: formylglycine-generating enzyme family protein [Deltaproteobacteria bacterium]|nr:formylglycine-generating enzyme family protein [Deltaproteobacteria bacterium]MBI3293683.1 formylglycine-generating enzyme family protein [Deltaproteobacteria bacterium]
MKSFGLVLCFAILGAVQKVSLGESPEIRSIDASQKYFEFVPVKPGTFKMGSPEGEVEHESNEKQREVTLTKPFQIQTTEVTQSLWKKVMKSNPSHFKGANLPVETVSWNDAQEFIKRLNARHGGGGYRYRLPTEAEWEYSARGGNAISSEEMQSAYFFGNDVGKLGDFAWFTENSGGKTHAVGTRGANALGLYDMNGNVWEFVQDLYLDDLSGLASVDPLNETSGYWRVMRGGRWGSVARLLRSANRYAVWAENRDIGVGLRLVRTVQ